MAISAEMDDPVEQLDHFLGYLAPALAQAPLRRIGRQVSLAVQSYLWDYVLMRHRFSSSGAHQMLRDVTAIWSVVDKHLGDGQGASGMRKLQEALTLLNVSTEQAADGCLSLEEVEGKIFESNDKAREVLDDMGLALLSESEARSIIERRVESGS